jgi:thioredoxin reductase (NADPH)
VPKPVILAIDDDPDVLASVARDLRGRYSEHYRVLRAESGVAALEVLGQLRNRDDPVALLLSDQRMPRMDGVTLLARARELFPEAKRALLTAYADTEAAIAAINRSQVDHFLLKPWDPPEEKLFPPLDDLLDDWRGSFRPPFEGIRVVADRWSADSHRIRDFLSRHQVPYRFLDVESSDEGRAIVARSNGSGSLPLVILSGGEHLSAPSNAQLAAAIGMRTRAAQAFYDLAIVGAGPAGLAAAVYGGSEGLRTVLIEREAPGGQAGTSSRIENYLGFPAGLSGSDLTRRAVAQVRKFDVELIVPQEVGSIRIEGPYKHIEIADGSSIACHVLMLSMGVAWAKLPAVGADALSGRGIYYGAAVTEAMLCRGETVYTVGAGNSAGQAAMHFAQYAARVVMLVRGDSLGAKMSSYLVHRIESTPNVEVRLNTEVRECHGAGRLEGMTIVDRLAGREERIDANFLFVFLGAAPRTDWLRGAVAMDARGFVLTGPDLQAGHLEGWPLARPPFLLEASVPGIFAAGDTRHESVKRVASAVGEGSVAVHFMHRYLAEV